MRQPRSAPLPEVDCAMNRSTPADTKLPAANSRRASVAVRVGNVTVGGDAPIVVQSMTNTDTTDVEGTAKQVAELARAGSELVRITVNSPQAAAAVPRIRERLAPTGCPVPPGGGFHLYRAKRPEQFAAMIECALEYGKPVRIGVNWGSLDPELLARMMDENAQRSEPL